MKTRTIQRRWSRRKQAEALARYRYTDRDWANYYRAVALTNAIPRDHHRAYWKRFLSESELEMCGLGEAEDEEAGNPEKEAD